MKDTIRALVARSQNEVGFENVAISGMRDGEVLVAIEFSSLNYKDALAVTGRGRIVRQFPMVVGIDLAGTVAESSSPEFKVGDRVLATGQELGEKYGGGYAEVQRVRADALVLIPPALSTEASMQLGTAGLTAMLCLMALEQNDVRPGDRELVVTGAAGGVGSIAVHLLARGGYRVAASTGRTELEPYLRDLGATSILPREELAGGSSGPLQKERWAGGIDTVGGATLANFFAQTAYEGAIACCGMAGGHELATTVWPLILRNVSLLGVSSIRTSKARRNAAWQRLAGDCDRAVLGRMSRTEPLSNIRQLAEEMLAGRVRGRIAIDVNR